jgi:hypothetical protein
MHRRNSSISLPLPESREHTALPIIAAVITTVGLVQKR